MKHDFILYVHSRLEIWVQTFPGGGGEEHKMYQVLR